MAPFLCNMSNDSLASPDPVHGLEEDRPTRRMMFATFLIPGTQQWIELVHQTKNITKRVTRIIGQCFDPTGKELASVTYALTHPMQDLSGLWPSPTDTALILNDMTYVHTGKGHPYQYGYLSQQIPHASPIHFPLAVCLGLLRGQDYSPLTYFPLGALPSWVGIRLYIGNVSEHATAEYHLIVHTTKGRKDRALTIPPLGHTVIDLPAGLLKEQVHFIAFRGIQKPIAYIAGVNRRNHALTFLEHFMDTCNLREEHEPPAMKRWYTSLFADDTGLTHPS